MINHHNYFYFNQKGVNFIMPLEAIIIFVNDVEIVYCIPIIILYNTVSPGTFNIFMDYFE